MTEPLGMTLDCKASQEGVGILHSGDERGIIEFTTAGVPLLPVRPRGEEAPLL